MSHVEAAGDGEVIASTAQPDGRVPTGDVAVDEVLGQLDSATDEPLDVQIEAAEEVHRVLKDRLADLGQE